MSFESIVTFYGSEVKTLPGGKIGGILVPFDSVDLVGDVFSKATDFYLDNGTARPIVLYDHGLDRTMKARKLGRGEVSIMDVGLWVEAQVELADEWAKAILKLVSEGKLSWSSGSAAHLVSRTPNGKSNHIDSWPIVEASLTPRPASMHTSAQALKSFAAARCDLEAFINPHLADAQSELLRFQRLQGKLAASWSEDQLERRYAYDQELSSRDKADAEWARFLELEKQLTSQANRRAAAEAEYERIVHRERAGPRYPGHHRKYR